MAGPNAAAAPRRVGRGQIAVACLLVALFAFDATVQLNGLLRGMHVAGHPAVGVGDLASLHPENVADVWRAHAAATAGDGGHADYEVVFVIHLIVDCAFALALGLLLYTTAGLLAGPSRPLSYARAAAIAYTAADLTENFLGAVVVFADTSLGWPLVVAAGAKWLSLASALALIGGLAIRRWGGADVRRGELRELAQLLRVLLIVAPLFCFALIAHPQVPDLIRRWTPLQLVLAFAFALFLALTIWVISCQLIRQTKPWKALRNPWVVVGIVAAIAAVQLVATLILRLVDAPFDLGWGLAIVAAITALGAVFGWIFGGDLHDQVSRDLGAGAKTVPALLAAVVLVGLGLGALRASFGESVFTGQLWDFDSVLTGPDEQLHPLVLIAFALLLPIAAWALYYKLTQLAPGLHDDGDGAKAAPGALVGGRWWILVAVAVAIELFVIVAVLSDVQGSSETGGGVAVFAAFLALVAMLAGAIVWVSDAVAYPKALPGKRSPIILILLAWLLIAAQIDRNGPHDARVVASAQTASAPQLGHVWACWLLKNGLDPGQRRCPFETDSFAYRTARDGGAVPLIAVATSGGATRAAYWTSTVLDCVFEVAGDGTSCDDEARVPAGDFSRSNTIFALSGVSGGAVGVATYAAHLAERADIGGRGAWIDARLDRDFLSPTASWSLFVEFPQLLLRYRHPVDSAEVLERSWEAAWGEGRARGDWRVFELWRTHHVVPLVLLNGTSVEDGCRFNGSVLDASVETVLIEDGGQPVRRFHDCRATGPFDDVTREGFTERLLPKSVLGGTRDLADFLCGRRLDVPLSTAAILSSRFPYVSPSGRIERRCVDQDQGNKVTFVVDGGYLETSGASPIVEIHERLAPMIRAHNQRPNGRACVVPFMIQIDNGYEDDAAPRAVGRPAEATVPPKTIVAARGARAAGAKAQAALLFDRGFDGATLDGSLLDDRYAHFVIQSHAGAKAPLGWALSATAREALRSQLTQPKNAAALKEVRRWLRPGALACR